MSDPFEPDWTQISNDYLWHAYDNNGDGFFYSLCPRPDIYKQC
jgi:hypothetical protein